MITITNTKTGEKVYLGKDEYIQITISLWENAKNNEKEGYPATAKLEREIREKLKELLL